jgi:hypothetical protein
VEATVVAAPAQVESDYAFAWSLAHMAGTQPSSSASSKGIVLLISFLFLKKKFNFLPYLSMLDFYFDDLDSRPNKGVQ